MYSIAIIGSGPTAIYTAYYLLSRQEKIHVTLFEAQADAGKGSPYHPKWNDMSMLANIASIELPPLYDTLAAWLESCDDGQLAEMGIERGEIDERAFYPRVALGNYFQAQLKHMAARHSRLDIRTSHRVEDIRVDDGNISVNVRHKNVLKTFIFSHVVMATGHNLPTKTEKRPGYFIATWPASALKTIGNWQVGIRGTSLSAIDAAVTLAQARGTFLRNVQGVLEYSPEPGTEEFAVTMMSRKGILPEADFYYPLPYEPLRFCTQHAVDALIETQPRDTLLEAVFALFKQELRYCDPAYALAMGLETATLEDFCARYFAPREQQDAFIWAQHNLHEAKQNQKQHHTVAWRYAILRMHEIIGTIVRHLPAESYARFQRVFKPMFVDDYATVPHLSIERLLALHHAGKLSVLKLGEQYRLDTKLPQGGAMLIREGKSFYYRAFIEATGQPHLSADDFPFPGLLEQGILHNATAQASDGTWEEIGGVALNSYHQPVSERAEASRIYCLSLPFILAQFPFAQGITSSHLMGKLVAGHIGSEDGVLIESVILGTTASRRGSCAIG